MSEKAYLYLTSNNKPVPQASSAYKLPFNYNVQNICLVKVKKVLLKLRQHEEKDDAKAVLLCAADTPAIGKTAAESFSSDYSFFNSSVYCCFIATLLRKYDPDLLISVLRVILLVCSQSGAYLGGSIGPWPPLWVARIV